MKKLYGLILGLAIALSSSTQAMEYEYEQKPQTFFDKALMVCSCANLASRFWNSAWTTPVMGIGPVALSAADITDTATLATQTYREYGVALALKRTITSTVSQLVSNLLAAQIAPSYMGNFPRIQSFFINRPIISSITTQFSIGLAISSVLSRFIPEPQEMIFSNPSTDAIRIIHYRSQEELVIKMKQQALDGFYPQENS